MSTPSGHRVGYFRTLIGRHRLTAVSGTRTGFHCKYLRNWSNILAALHACALEGAAILIGEEVGLISSWAHFLAVPVRAPRQPSWPPVSSGEQPSSRSACAVHTLSPAWGAASSGFSIARRYLYPEQRFRGLKWLEEGRSPRLLLRGASSGSQYGR